MAPGDQSAIPEVKMAGWLKEGWEIFVSDIGMFILAGIIYAILNSICFPILFGPLTCGMYLMIFDRMNGEKAEVKRLFGGFDFFGPAFWAGLIFSGLTILGWLAMFFLYLVCVIPALIGVALLVLLQTAFLFTFQLIIQKHMTATEAISTSFNKTRENLWEFLLFGLVIWVFSLAGYGVILTTPLALAAAAAAYRDTFGIEGPAPETLEADVPT
jgi:uncharacterized membrane protein